MALSPLHLENHFYFEGANKTRGEWCYAFWLHATLIVLYSPHTRAETGFPSNGYNETIKFSRETGSHVKNRVAVDQGKFLKVAPIGVQSER